MTEKVEGLYHKWYKEHKKAFGFLFAHSVAVAEFAVPIAQKEGYDVNLVREGALLHDIGIVKTNAPSIGCFGSAAYITHGVAGAEMLRAEGFPELASICETHVGVAITADEIGAQRLPLPCRDMVPCSQEEVLIAYADKFFSKRPEYLTQAKPIEVVLQEISQFGERPVAIFKSWHKQFTGEQL